MRERGVKASFALGGIPAAIIDMYDEGLVRVVECSQSFDAVAARAIYDRQDVVEIDNADYANAYSKGGFLNREDFGVLGALEVDTDFNVNILTGSSGEMMGGLGGGPDVAGGAAISIVTLPIIRGRTPSIVKRVLTLCTPRRNCCGSCDRGRHSAESQAQKLSGAERGSGKNQSQTRLHSTASRTFHFHDRRAEGDWTTDRITCIVEYRDGTVIDVIRQIKR